MALITGLLRTEQLNKEAEYIKLMMDDINEDLNKRILGHKGESTSFDYRILAPSDGKGIGWADSGMDNITIT